MKHIDMKKIYSILALLCATFMVVSCSNDLDNAEEVGYLKMELTTLVSTNTRAVTGVPSGYNAKTLHVELRKADGTIIMQTDDFENASDFQGTIVLTPGSYIIEAHSANWDGSDSGFGTPFYTGFTNVTVKAKELTTANLTLTQANVKVTVTYDNSFRTYFSSAQTVVTSAIDGVAPRSFRMNQTVGSAYFPVGDLSLMVSATNKSGVTNVQTNEITDVKARDHYNITYKIAEAGKLGGVSVSIDDATQTYTYTVEVPRKSSIALQANNLVAWSRFANLSGAVTAKTSDFDATAVTMQWKLQNAEEWTTVANSALTVSGDNYSYKLTGLTPETSYTYRLVYATADASVNSNEVTFTTGSETPIYNGGFENWYKDGNVWYPNASGTSYWDSSNPGSAGLMGESYNVTKSTTSKVHSGTYAAELGSQWVIIKFAAASLYTGQFDALNGTKSAKLYWGVPFTARPTALKGYMIYQPGSINRGDQPSGVGAPSKGSNDVGQVRVALLTERLHVDNGDMSTFPDWYGGDSRVIAYGEYEQSTTDSDWKEFNIPLTYYNTTVQPTHILVLFSSSKYGDYFYGSDSSKMYLDDLELVYGDNPVIQ